MAVSLSQVQSVISGQTSTGGTGALTLNVLHKTDALVSKLLALDPTKSLTIQVLKAQNNGRAQIQVGKLQLEVKSSLPLKAGEVLQLKFEQTGSALRFVQAPKTTIHPGAATKPPVTQAPVNKVNGQSFAQVSNQIASTQTSNTAQQPQTNIVQHPAGQQPQSQIKTGAGAPPQTIVKTTTAPTTQTQVVQTGAQNNASTTVSTNPQLAIQSTTTALLRAVTEVLPEVAKKLDGKNTNSGQTDKNSSSSKTAQNANVPGSKNSSSRTSQGPTSQGLNTNGQTAKAGATPLPTGPSPEKVNASYRAASQNLTEETHEIRGLPQRPADITIELPLTNGQNSVAISLYLDHEAHHGPEHDETETGHGVRFSLETSETGVIYAEMTLRQNVVRLGLWAQRFDITEQIQEALPILAQRLEATGFKVGGLFVRHGVAPDEITPSTLNETIEHLDQKI